MNSFVLGRYLPYNSIIHNMDPRAKMLAMLIMMIAIFMPTGFVGYGILGIVIMMIVIISKLSFKFLWKSIKPMLFMLVFLLIINLLVVKRGYVLFHIHGFYVYSEALFQTLYIVVRLVLMIMITTLLTATTKPLDLTLAIEDLLAPFKIFHVPAHEIAMMISIALRFIPTLLEETQRIMKAQASRGVDLKEGKIKEKIIGIVSLIVPLFISAFQRADDLAEAMEARGYAPGKTRTRYKQLKMQTQDYLLILGSIILLGSMIAIWIL